VFCLAIGSGVSNENVLDRYVSLIAEVPEVGSGESQTKIGDYAVREAEAVNYPVEQLGCFLAMACTKGLYSIHFENLSMQTYTE
jgi:hypothetical protein